MPPRRTSHTSGANIQSKPVSITGTIVVAAALVRRRPGTKSPESANERSASEPRERSATCLSAIHWRRGARESESGVRGRSPRSKFRTRRPVRPARSSRARRWHTARGARARPVATREAVVPRAGQWRALSTRLPRSVCPISTPTLKNSKATGIDVCGRPTSASAPAKPNPRKLNVQATIQGSAA